MHQWIRSSVSLIALLILVACGVAANRAMQNDQADQITSATALPLAFDALPQSEGATTTMDQTAAQPIIDLVKADLARYLNVPIDQIMTIEIADRTWPDRGLGCRVRRGVFPTEQTPGYLITLEHNGQHYPYHTDRSNTFVRCMNPGKPLDRITR